MFYYFFQQYKNEIYLANRKKLKINEILMIVVLIVSTIVLSIFAMLQRFNIITIISLLILIIDFTYMVIYVKKTENQRVAEKVLNYKNTKISPLIELLNSDTYNLYTVEGLDWLIEYCSTETNKTAFKISIQGIVLPFITLAYGVILNNLNLTEIVVISITFICILLTVIMLGKMVQPIVDDIVYPDKTKYSCLKSQLEYIKTQF
ncbi:hypothetical protein CS063_16800 [Sporanaerobium hydrogeniformans]|uniref:Uncharacterized protein n=1 Tax=Sporanaerobium hydrogeniformans TaxID=3072179 RepID=A0AC61D977_9FIRM|nr:hypothetical protein [Sporanaerobium hydrogeniformans]PHV69246.1 hypothetical protein CS063_16800 [Sporanaerobium hydrogeniformans]